MSYTAPLSPTATEGATGVGPDMEAAIQHIQQAEAMLASDPQGAAVLALLAIARAQVVIALNQAHLP